MSLACEQVLRSYLEAVRRRHKAPKFKERRLSAGWRVARDGQLQVGHVVQALQGGLVTLILA